MGSQRLREALAGPTKDKDKKEPFVVDGILSVTPDPPEAAEWRNKSVLDTVAADSTFLEDETGVGTALGHFCCAWAGISASMPTACVSCLFFASGKRPNGLFGKWTWRIENFSDFGHNGKRELRSAQFDVGEYKWCVRIDPAQQPACLSLHLVLMLLWGCCCCGVAGTYLCIHRAVMCATTYHFSCVWQTMTSSCQVIGSIS